MELLTVNEVANHLRVSPMTVRRHIAAGRLRAVRIGRGIRIRRDAVERFVVPVASGEAHARIAGEFELRPFTLDDPLWDIVGMIDDDGPSDASINHAAYLTDAYGDLHDR